MSVILLVLLESAVLSGCWAVGLRVLSVISSGYLSVPRIPQFLGFSHTPRDVFALLVQNRPPDLGLTACFEGFRAFREGVLVLGGWKCWCCAWNCLWGCAKSPSWYRIALPVECYLVGFVWRGCLSWLLVLCPVDSVLSGCRAVGLGVLSVISSGYLSVPRIPQFLGFSHTLRDVFTLPI